MPLTRKRRDNTLIDAIEAIDPIEFSGSVWRVVRDGRDATRCSRSGGRWDDGTFDVLYTSQEQDGAISEMYFHLLRGQPILPSQVSYRVFELGVQLDRALRFLDLDALRKVGLDTTKYGQLSYQEREMEYPRSQDIGEVAHFLEYDGLIAPSARHECLNVVLFCDRIPPSAMAVKRDCGSIDWAKWDRAQTSQRRSR